jgi:hypothetical protein
MPLYQCLSAIKQLQLSSTNRTNENNLVAQPESKYCLAVLTLCVVIVNTAALVNHTVLQAAWVLPSLLWFSHSSFSCRLFLSNEYTIHLCSSQPVLQLSIAILSTPCNLASSKGGPGRRHNDMARSAHVLLRSLLSLKITLLCCTQSTYV